MIRLPLTSPWPVLLLLLLPFGLIAQSNTPTTVRTTSFQDSLKVVFEKIYQQTTASISGNYKKEYLKLYEELKDSRRLETVRSYFADDAGIRQYFNGIVSQIRQANPTVFNREIHLLVTKDAFPNAVTYPDGVIYFHAGLLADCENESQVAFILCHELAHHALNHGAQSIAKRFDALYSKKAQKEMNAIAKQDNAYEKAKSYLEAFTFEHRRHGREFETEADSLAARMLSRTNYDALQSIRALEMLNSVDSNLYVIRFDIKTIFNFKEYPFKNKWLEEENTLFKDGKRVFDDRPNQDSLKTHPDCLHRAMLVKDRFIGTYSAEGKTVNPQSDESFNRVRAKAGEIALTGLLESGNPDLCLARTLNRLQAEPDNAFLCTLAGQCFNAMVNAQKDHTFGKLVALPQLQYEPGYRRWLQFLNKMRPSELATVGYLFLQSRAPNMSDSESFQYELLVAAKNAEHPEEVNRLKMNYLKQFPEGRHKNAVVQNF